MKTTSTIGLDLAKNVFQIHGADAAGVTTIKRQLKRRDVIPFFSRLSPCLVGMEACGTAHYWARELVKLGHTVKMMPPRYVKGYLKRGKTDAADAEAICEAVTRPRIKEVPVKSVEQQCLGMPHKVRELLKGQQVALGNAIRAHMAELGLVALEGRKGLLSLLAIVVDQTRTELPSAARRTLRAAVAALAQIEASLDALDLDIHTTGKSNETVKRLQTIPGIGPIAASAFVATITNPQAFADGRAFAASLGVTPKLMGTGGQVTLGSITKQGNRHLRKLLYLGSVARLNHAKRFPAKADPKLVALLKAKKFKVAAVALANKTARIVWALMARGGTFAANHQPRPLALAQAAGA
jgi:transposase